MKRDAKWRWTIAKAALAGAMVLMASCSTTSGSLYSGSVSSEESAAAEARRRAEERRKPQGNQPSPQPGGGQYYPSGDDDGGASAEFVLNLIVETARAVTAGSLELTGLPPGARVTIDGSFMQLAAGGGTMGGLRLDLGLHYVEVEAFGYQGWSGTVEIDVPRKAVTIPVMLATAPFTMGGVSVSPEVFDPLAPGRLGEARIFFHATGPGTAEISILDRDGDSVWSRQGLRIAQEDSAIPWDGKGVDGRVLPPGDYRVQVSATGADGAAVEDRAFVTISPFHTTTSHSSLAGGFSGGMLAPDARVLPEGHFSGSLGGYAVLDPTGGADTRMPVFGGLRLALGGATELVASGMGVFYPAGDGSTDSWSAAGSVKTRLSEDATNAVALLVGGAYSSFLSYDPNLAIDTPSPWDGPARFRGVYAGLVVESDSEEARGYASLQAQVSDYYPNYDFSDPAKPLPGFYVWLYLRGGIEFLLPDLLGSEGTLAITAAGRTSPFAGDFAFVLPLSIAAELHWYIPDSSQVLSFYASGEWADKRDFYLGGGIGIGFML